MLDACTCQGHAPFLASSPPMIRGESSPLWPSAPVSWNRRYYWVSGFYEKAPVHIPRQAFSEAESKENMVVWNPMPELTINHLMSTPVQSRLQHIYHGNWATYARVNLNLMPGSTFSPSQRLWSKAFVSTMRQSANNIREANKIRDVSTV